MKKYFILRILLSCAFLSVITYSKAQERIKTEGPKFITLNKNSIINAKATLKKSLNTNEEDDFKSVTLRRDNLGYQHEKFQQYYKGLKVEFSTYTVHSKNRKIKNANGNFKIINNLSITPKLTAEEAFKKALDYVNATEYMWEFPEQAKAMGDYKKPTGELVVFPLLSPKRDGSKTTLAYKFDIFAAKPTSRGYVYIDANTGEKLLYNAIIKHLGEFSHGKRWNDHEVENHHGHHNHHSHLSIIDENNMEMVGQSGLLTSTNNAETRYSGIRFIETRNSEEGYTLNDETRKVYTRNANNQDKTGGYPYVTNYTEFVDNDNFKCGVDIRH